MSIAYLRKEYESRVRAHEARRAVLKATADRYTRATELAKVAHDQSEACAEAAKLLAQFSDERQGAVLKALEDIVSNGLSQVFDEPMELKLTQVVRAKRVELDITVKTGNLETPILEARGGGLAAVAGFILRVAVIMLSRTRKILVLDETFAQLSEDYVPRMAEFISELCKDTGLQIIMVTHQPEFAEAADKVYRIEKTGVNTSRLVEQ
jgi:DNA repair ATPase RecN